MWTIWEPASELILLPQLHWRCMPFHLPQNKFAQARPCSETCHNKNCPKIQYWMNSNQMVEKYRSKGNSRVLNVRCQPGKGPWFYKILYWGLCFSSPFLRKFAETYYPYLNSWDPWWDRVPGAPSSITFSDDGVILQFLAASTNTLQILITGLFLSLLILYR